jgi:Protein of unknown function (DUF1549)/Protein of unknown function (DUF1553)/Planctomycete cytochrome C
MRFPVVLVLIAGLAHGFAAEPKAAAPWVDFSSQVRPILSSKCFPCHGPDESGRKAGLRLDTFDEATLKRKHGTPVVPGKPAESELVARINSADPEVVMPPPEVKLTLKEEEREILRRWIAGGARYATHWAWAKPVAPPTPAVRQSGWVRNGIDAFVLEKLEEKGLTPAPEADRETLARRVALDLTGLPPDPDLFETFVRDGSNRAYERYVDQLLASSAYGERWARLWLDLGRYADSAGYGSDPLRLGIWPWRDWLIRALNRNEPFDEFTRDLLAGDLVPNPTDDQVIATGFHRNTMTNTEGGTDDEEYRVAAVKDRVGVTGQVWMGVTLGCAQCHSHKYDPISQREYYSMFAIFNQTEDNDQPDESPTMPIRSRAELDSRRELAAEIADADKALKAGKEALEGSWENQFGPPPLLLHRHQLQRQFDGIRGVPLPIMREVAAAKRRTTHFLNKGNFLDPGPEVQPAVLSAFNRLPPGAPANRLGLAAWLTSADNPLTARVAVNRYWSQMLGKAVVETEEDFGTQGALPSNQKLLDFLAVAFETRPASPKAANDPRHPAFGWDVKALLRYIATSATYRQASAPSKASLVKDPANRFYSHANRRRLEAEMIRDQTLAVSGLLSRKIGGPSVYPAQPDGLWRAAFNGERTWTSNEGEDRYRRGIYTFWRRTVPYPSMAALDAPSREACTVRRQPTNTPLQAFVTLNDPAFVEAAQAFARLIANHPGAPEEKAAWAFRRALFQTPKKEEIDGLAALYRKELAAYSDRVPDANAFAADPLGPLPSGLDAPEAAAWTTVANVLINLDRFLVDR